MKEANIKRLERASDIYYLRKCVSQYAYDANTLRRIVKVAREDKE